MTTSDDGDPVEPSDSCSASRLRRVDGDSRGCLSEGRDYLVRRSESSATLLAKRYMSRYQRIRVDIRQERAIADQEHGANRASRSATCPVPLKGRRVQSGSVRTFGEQT
jgi:hypothetical protein